MKETKEKEKKNVKPIIVGVTAILVIALVVGVVLFVVLRKPSKLTTIAESKLKEVLEIGELSTVEYTYNSIVTVKDGKTEMYHVSYEGTVKVGFDFDDIKVSQEGKKTIITIPEMKVNDVSVDGTNLDFIFLKDKYETETVHSEAYNICVKDLKKKAEGNEELFEMAKDGAIETVEALIQPYVDQLEEGYSVEVR